MLVTLINSKSSSLPPPVLLVSKPSDPSPPPPPFPFPKDCSLSLPGLPGQPPPPGVRGECVSLCMRDTLGLYGGRGSLPHPLPLVLQPQYPPPNSLGPYGPQGWFVHGPILVSSLALGGGLGTGGPPPPPPFAESPPPLSLHLTIAAAGLGSGGGD